MKRLEPLSKKHKIKKKQSYEKDLNDFISSFVKFIKQKKDSADVTRWVISSRKTDISFLLLNAQSTYIYRAP